MNIRYDMIAVHVVRPTASGSSHEFLQLRRAADDYLGGTWQIVRGTSHTGEKAWEAALRELKEETGLVPREFYKLSLMEHFYLVPGETVWHVPSFVAVINREDAVRLNEEHDALRWIPRDRIDAETMWAGERLVLAEVMREILDSGLSKPHLGVPIRPEPST
ncbi:NUDIX domain-containing protein [Humisphaera borealis]|uniref:NUDIX domain-containing protein n=1 Tax=Humisphaera borealis TaxID=2807512 RepID=A0A7M2WTP6_9BACT|nr:NUDIX domain-containing protein [Humisphaera borealis]QOV88856.1 NUDIX domain-containing protein [Humisphaera borealis]